MTRRSLLNLLSLFFLVVAAAMLGKSCWIHVKAQVAQVLLERAFERSLASGKAERPWGWADMWPVARISVPRLGTSDIVLNATSGEALAFGPGLLQETSAFGERGTTVVAAHRDTHFTYLKDMQIGDVIDVTRNDGLNFRYRVSGLRVVDWNRSGIDRNAPGFNLVLSTCWPLDSILHGSKRLLVEASLVN